MLELENWAEIKEEMMVSNVIQRDNVILARKLHPDLEPAAKINDKNVRMRIDFYYIDVYKTKNSIARLYLIFVTRYLLNVQAKSEQLWTWTARRDVVQTVLDAWVSEAGEEATLETLLLALNYPDFKDVKMRVERMVHLAS